MSKFRIDVSGSVIVEADTAAEAREVGLFLKDTLDNIHPGKFRVSGFDFAGNNNLSLTRFDNIVAYTGRQESEGLVQGIVRMLVQGKLVNADVSDSTGDITERSIQLDDATRHYSVDYGKLYDETLPFAMDSETFAVDFKNVISDVLLNNATRGAAFMKKAKG